jgi:hypothetical protein
MDREMKRMSTRNRVGSLLMGLCLAGLVSVGTSTASAQQVQVSGPLAGAPAVHHMRIYRENRLMLVPHIGMTLRDPWQRTMMVGGQLHYHFTDWLGLGLWGSYGGVNFNTDLTNQVIAGGMTSGPNRLSLPSRDGFGSQLGQTTWAAGPQVNFVPLRGKLALFQKLFVDTDFYVQAGVVFMGIQERADINAATCNAIGDTTLQNACFIDSQSARANRIAIRPSFGTGLNMYFNSVFGLQIEWRGFPVSMNESGTDEAGPNGMFPDGSIDSNDRISRLHHMVSIGLILFLPASQKVTD